jgi:hypothetical protein
MKMRLIADEEYKMVLSERRKAEKVRHEALKKMTPEKRREALLAERSLRDHR